MCCCVIFLLNSPWYPGFLLLPDRVWILSSFTLFLLFFFLKGFFGLEACGILIPQPGVEPAPPAVEGEVLTTTLPGKSPHIIFFSDCVVIWIKLEGENSWGIPTVRCLWASMSLAILTSIIILQSIEKWGHVSRKRTKWLFGFGYQRMISSSVLLLFVVIWIWLSANDFFFCTSFVYDLPVLSSFPLVEHSQSLPTRVKLIEN